jgi:flagellar biosynthesis/type III secretory pathway M-ring protein FliF/YscJ
MLSKRLQAVVVAAIVILVLFAVVLIVFLGPKSNTPAYDATTDTTIEQCR